MTVREFDGVDDALSTATGALSTNAFGTFAALVRRTALAEWQTALGLHSSAGVGLNLFGVAGGNQSVLYHANGTESTGPLISDTTNWRLIVVRKASGTATPRFSVYNYGTGTWTHANGSAALPNWTAPGTGGSVRFIFGLFDPFQGRIAARAAWNTVRWTADAAGDAALAAAGLEDALQSWIDADPDACWHFNQPVATAVADLTGGGADQTSITGTTAITGDDPPGFSFALGGSTTLARAGGTSGARALTAVKVTTLGRAGGSSSARALAGAKAATLGRTGSTSGSRAVAPTKASAVGRSGGSAGTGPTSTTKTAPLAGSAGTAGARPPGSAKVTTLGRAGSAASASPLIPGKQAVLGGAGSTSGARSLSPAQGPLGSAGGAAAARPVASGKFSPVGPSGTSAGARPVAPVKIVVLGQADGSSGARAVTPGGKVTTLVRAGSAAAARPFIAIYEPGDLSVAWAPGGPAASHPTGGPATSSSGGGPTASHESSTLEAAHA